MEKAKPMNELDLVVFDLAGTTVEDHGQVADAFTAALAACGVTVTPDQLQGVRGRSKRQAVQELVPDGPDRAQRVEAVYRLFVERLAKCYRTDGVRAVPGAEEVFRWFGRRNIRVALNTGFDRAITDLLLNALGWANRMVDAVVCGDEVKRGRPAPDLILRAMEITGTNDAHRVASVGDTALDLQAGHNAGVRWNIGVLSGAHSRSLLEQAPHSHLLADITQLPSVWAGSSRWSSTLATTPGTS